jgi:ATP-GRASP peptide maturase of grasp-with-spasm system
MWINIIIDAMVLIISENNDLFTDTVIEWLYFFSVSDIVRINEDDTIHIKEIDFQKNTIVLNIKNETINLSDIDFFWYRRGSLNHLINEQIDFENVHLNGQIINFLNYEWLMCRNYIFYWLRKKQSLGNFFGSATNKFINLKIAKECGLEIPETYISEFSSNLMNFQNEFSVITKPIGEVMPINCQEDNYKMLTTEVKKDFFSKGQHIFPTLLQKQIPKQIEIRVFIMYEKIYAMAIFSQKNIKTNVDFRNYDREKMNRMTPYILPIDIQQKILIFMQKIGLDTGSIDIIKTPNNSYVFLEVNPAGNIEMVSRNCNYNIEKEIAKTIKNKKQNERE